MCVCVAQVLAERAPARGAKVARHDDEDMAAARREAETHRDILWLNTTEAFHLCAMKKLLWYRAASAEFPAARYFVIADDDAYVQLEHLEADLRATHSAPPAPSVHLPSRCTVCTVCATGRPALDTRVQPSGALGTHHVEAQPRT